MKKDIHPKYYPEAKVICACGNTWTTGSTVEVIHTEMCSACHPFFTGEQRIVDTAGQVDRFQRRKEKAELIAEETARRRMGKEKKEESLFEFVSEEKKQPTPGEAAPAEAQAVGEQAATVVTEKPKTRRTTSRTRASKAKGEGKAEAAPKTAGRKKAVKAAKKREAKSPVEQTSGPTAGTTE